MAFNKWQSGPTDPIPTEASDSNKIESALAFLASYGQSEGEDRKAWVIDQTARILAGHGYEQFVKDARKGKQGPHTHPWAEGVAP